MRKGFGLSLACLTGAMILSGCAGQERLDRYKKLQRQNQATIEDLRHRLDEARSRIQALENASRDTATLRNKLEQARAKRKRLEEALSRAEEKLSELGKGAPLPEKLDDALVELARTNPELMTYNPDRSMIKFQSDLTFGLGSAAVNDAAVDSLEQLAEIVSRPVAQGYEVRIVGHTDNVPIAKPETKKKHPSNWHLSVHRAIAVRDVLEQAGVKAERFGVCGYGPHRPIVANKTGPEGDPEGAKANRRVEVFLMPMGEDATSPKKSSGDQGKATTEAGDGNGEKAGDGAAAELKYTGK